MAQSTGKVPLPDGHDGSLPENRPHATTEDATILPMPASKSVQDPNVTVLPGASAADPNATMLPGVDPDVTILPTSGASRSSTPAPDDARTMLDRPGSGIRRPATHARSAVSSEAQTLGPGEVAAAASTGTSAEEGPLTVGEPFGPRYQIERVLGVGGMGAVYQAWDAELGVDVAVKVIRPEIAADPEAAVEIERRFKRELLLARQVTHPNIIRIHDLGDIDGIKYITMPFIEGSDLATILKEEQKLPVPRALRIARGTVAGLVAAHNADVVHRDLKPANLMVAADDTPVIMDFGIARSAGGPGQGPAPRALSPIRPAELSRTAAAAASSTMAGAIVGTVAYMAPEQARGEVVDQRADIYAFGLIMYDMIVGGRRSERAPSAIAELQQRMQTAPPAPRSIDPTIPEAVDEIIRRCLEPDPAKRFQTTVELQQALERLDENGEPLPIIRRVSLRTMMAAVATMLLALAGAWYYALQQVVPVEHGPVTVLVANFNNSTGDPIFDGSLEHALTVNLEGTSFIGTFDRFEARRIAERTKQGATLDDDGSRLVAQREGINVVLAGSIAPRDAGYSIAVRAVDPSNGRQLWVESASATSKGEVLQVLGSVAAEVRKQLGDDAPRNERMAAANIVADRRIDSLRSYALAQELFLGGKAEEALPHYERAVEADPNFGRAYANWGLAAYSLGRKDDAEALSKKALSLADRMTEQEKYSTLSSYYATINGNYEKAIETLELQTQVSRGNARAYNNLAFAYFKVRNFPKAMEAARKALEIFPRNIVGRVNYALYAMYTGDFDTASRQAAEMVTEVPRILHSYIPLAMGAILKGDFDAARATYEQMAGASAQGPSWAAIGLADLAMYRGAYTDAEAILTAAIAEARSAGQTARLNAKLIALAETYEATGRMPLALKTVREAVTIARDEATLVPAALLLLRARQSSEAQELAADLDNTLQTQTRAYAKIIDGKVALLNRRRATAIDSFREAIKLADTWLARFEMGVTYVEAGLYAEAFDELDACVKRHGEVTAMFLDESPTIRYYATLPYWLARAQEGLGQQAAATASYQSFLTLRGDSPNDPLVIDAKKRTGN